MRPGSRSFPGAPYRLASAIDVRVSTESASPDEIEGERKIVTALFADIKGSTALMEDLDPEQAHALVDPVMRLMVDAVHRYGGYVARSTGDGTFALFGAPVAYEDHPQRALYAGLRLQDELKRYSANLREAGNQPIEARVGSEQQAVGDVEYTFKHALTQEVAYSSVLVERRRGLHQRVAEAVESLHADRLHDHYAELARHFDRGGDGESATRYLYLAGQQALARSAFHEALGCATRGLELIGGLSESAGRAEQELGLLDELSRPG